jgi:hypothetical protein
VKYCYTIMLKMDAVEVVPEFGTIAMMIFAIVVSI